MKIPTTLFKGKSVAPVETTRYTWDDLVGEMSELAEVESDKLSLPSLVFAKFSGDRCNANMGRAHAITIDVDFPGDTDKLLAHLQKWRCFVYETPSSTDEAPRLRVVVPLEKSIAPAAVPYSKMAFAEAVGLDPVESGVAGAKAASQPSFFGRRPGERERMCEAFEGEVWVGPTKPPPQPENDELLLVGLHGDTVPDLSEIAAHVPPAGRLGERRKLVRALGGWLAREGYSPGAIAQAVAEQIPSDDPDGRGAQAQEAAERVLSGEITAGWSEIARWSAEVAGGDVDLPAVEKAAKDPCGWLERYLERGALSVKGRARRARAEMVLSEAEAADPPDLHLLDELDLDDDGRPYATPGNLAICVRQLLGDAIARNAASGRVMVTKTKRFADVGGELLFEGPDLWGPIHTTRLHALLSREPYAIRRAGRGDLDHAIVSVAARQMWWPIKEYLKGLEWDGRDRNLADYLSTPDTYARTVCSMWLRSAVARAFVPGCQVDHLLVLEGRQGASKSSLLRALGGEWYTAFTARPEDAKATGEQLQGAWVSEIEEFDKISSRATAAALKAVLTRTTDTYRQAYGVHAETFPRTAVFAATTNADKYLDDPTGARRVWPVRVGEVDVRGAERDRDQIWAQAVCEYLAGERWWPEDPELIETLSEATADRQIVCDDPWLPAIQEWIAKRGPEPFAMADITAFGRGAVEFDLSQMRRGEVSRIQACLRALGCTRADGFGKWAPPSEGA